MLLGLLIGSVVTLLWAPGAIGEAPPDARGAVCREVKLNEPQLFLDDFLIDNRYNEDDISAKVVHVLLPPKRSAEPLMRPDLEMPWEATHGIGYTSVLFDPDAQRFRLYYQIWNPKTNGENPSGYSTAYAESEDGLNWERPLFDFVLWNGEKTNILLRGEGEAKAPHVHLVHQAGIEASSGKPIRNVGMLPPEALRGHPYLMFYCDHEHFLATSEDGIHWSPRQQMILPNRVDCFSTIVHDPARNEYVMFYRNKLIYHDGEGRMGGNPRMIARIASPDLWRLWEGMPSTVLIPDSLDGGRFYNMPTVWYGGAYLGFLEQFHEQPQHIEVELAVSRDGFDWRRLPERPALLPYGAPGTWEDGMVFASDRFIERGDEWWLYYSAYDGPHDTKDRTSCLGLARFGKERLIAVRSDPDGKRSYLVTKPFAWPGGELLINANASAGSLRALVSDLERHPFEGFSFDDSRPFEEDAARHPMHWEGASMEQLTGKLVRLEFEFVNADLFGFIASKKE